MATSTESAMVNHLKNLILSDPVLNDYLEHSNPLNADSPRDKAILQTMRFAQLILIMFAVCAEFGRSKN